MKVKGKYVILSFVCLVLGFMISFSYQFTKKAAEEQEIITDQQWNKESAIRKQILEIEEENRLLQKELFERQEEIREIEANLAKKEQEQVYYNLVQEVEKYRMYVGETQVQGQGVQVTLEDASYVPTEEDVNNYLVHESHLFKVINELYISGAQAISVNGKRLTRTSYLYCNGPVITIDGNPYPAPFIITAIGDPEVLIPALNIHGGVKEQLVQDNILVKIEGKTKIIMDSILQSNEL